MPNYFQIKQVVFDKIFEVFPFFAISIRILHIIKIQGGQSHDQHAWVHGFPEQVSGPHR